MAVYIIGLTGNIAAGKSTVARLLRERGATVIDADALAHAAMAPGSAVWEAIRQTFGSQVIAGDGTIDRRQLGAIVFANPEALAKLEAIVHPAVGRAIQARLAELQRAPERPRAVVIEAIKLLEAGLDRLCDAVWIVVAPRAVQSERLVRSRGLSPEEAALRIDAQGAIEPKLARADEVIVNDGSLEDLKGQVEKAWEAIPDDET